MKEKECKAYIHTYKCPEEDCTSCKYRSPATLQTQKCEITYNISIDPPPQNCRECPFFLHDEKSDHCQFGAKERSFSALQRVKDCPLR